jgi:tetratricopeptide (TPR) repeat protein
MKSDKFILALLISFLCGAFPLIAGDFQLVYLDGTLELAAGGRHLEVGSSIPEDSSVVLGNGSLAELISDDSTILLSKGGTYRLSSLVSKKENSSSSAMSSIFGKVAKIGSEGSKVPSAAMGVRGAETDANFSFEWVEEDSLSFDEAIAAYEDGDYALAAAILKEEVDPTLLEDETKYWYYLASARLASGRRGEALKTVMNHDGNRLSEEYGKYLLLKGRLYLESLNYSHAAGVYKSYLDSVSANPQKQIGSYFYGYSLLQDGREGEGKRVLRQAVKLDVDPDITQAAQDLLNG